VHDRAYSRSMAYVWDPLKALRNIDKHGVDFSDATAVLEDDLALTDQDPDILDEERYLTLGFDSLGRLLVVVWTRRQEDIRLISARRATARERRRYGET
jgi:uncharacterized protein